MGASGAASWRPGWAGAGQPEPLEVVAPPEPLLAATRAVSAVPHAATSTAREAAALPRNGGGRIPRRKDAELFMREGLLSRRDACAPHRSVAVDGGWGRSPASRGGAFSAGVWPVLSQSIEGSTGVQHEKPGIAAPAGVLLNACMP
jgi:hypothetical protein